jgi:hypothetical protein
MSSVGSPTTASPKDLSPRATSPILATTPGRECSTRTGVADRVVTNLTTSDSGLNATSAAMVLTLLLQFKNFNIKPKTPSFIQMLQFTFSIFYLQISVFNSKK